MYTKCNVKGKSIFSRQLTKAKQKKSASVFFLHSKIKNKKKNCTEFFVYGFSAMKLTPGCEKGGERVW